MKTLVIIAALGAASVGTFASSASAGVGGSGHHRPGLSRTASSSSAPAPAGALTPTTAQPTTAQPTTAAPSACTVPLFTPEVTDYRVFREQAAASGCRFISFNGLPGRTPVATIHAVGGYVGPPNADGDYLPSQYAVGGFQPGQVLPGGSLVVASVNGVAFYHPHW